MPCLYEWQHFQAGGYAFGIEPSTHHSLGDLAARDRGEMIWLQGQDERCYDSTFRILDGADQMAAVGVKRVSVGGALSRLALAAFMKGARDMKAGSFTWMRETMPTSDLKKVFRD